MRKICFHLMFLSVLAIASTALADPIPPDPADPNEEAGDICRKYCQGQEPDLRNCLANQQTFLYGETGLSYAIYEDDTVSDVATLYSISDQWASDSLYSGGGAGGGCGAGD